MKTMHAVVTGRVQGVGFRFFVENRAAVLGLRGWVRNLRTGQVEVLATGEEGVLRTFLEDLREGPRLAKVTGVEVDWDSPACEEPFHTRAGG